jgi:hypothetical protein
MELNKDKNIAEKLYQSMIKKILLKIMVDENKE